VDRSTELDRILEKAKLDDAVVDTTATSIAEVATAVLVAVGW
jgi:hypothetical protein